MWLIGSQGRASESRCVRLHLFTQQRLRREMRVRWEWDGGRQVERWWWWCDSHVTGWSCSVGTKRETLKPSTYTHTHTHRHCPDTHPDDWQGHQPRVWTQSQEKYIFFKQSGLISFHERGTNKDKRISKPALVELNRSMQLDRLYRLNSNLQPCYKTSNYKLYFMHI